MSRSSGRLELTWTNKDMRLLSHGESTYEWVDPQDWRVSEVRLLNPVDSVGEDDSSNLLIQGDALHALTALSSLPDLAERYVGKVRLCYIDPPFNTGQTFRNYDDAVEHSVWLTMLRDRLVQVRKLLSRDGSVWVHLDDMEQHRARCVASVEEPDSPVRVIVSVSMLKEGWDVKNIFVICSLRPSISDVLTEQTPGARSPPALGRLHGGGAARHRRGGLP